jgi:phage-related protein
MIHVVFFREEDGSTPFLDWFRGLPDKAQDNCRVRLERLCELGHLLRRPEADYLRDGIYELRAKAGGINYRMLYFFHGKAVVVISHGLTKQQAVVPPKEIDRAIVRRKIYASDPVRHTHSLEEAP